MPAGPLGRPRQHSTLRDGLLVFSKPVFNFAIRGHSLCPFHPLLAMQTPLSLSVGWIGRHFFRSAFISRAIKLAALAFLAFVPALQATNYIIKSDSPDFVDLANVGLEPGDTVFIEAHTRQKLIIQNLTVGTEEQPIRITNQGGQFIIDTTTTDKGLHFYNCSHFILRGTPAPDHSYEYGIKLARVSQAGAIGLAFIQGSTDFEVSHVEIANVGFAGVMAKSDSLNRTQFTMRNVSFHHLYIHDTGGEAIYVGSSSYHDTGLNPHEIHGLSIHDNLIENAGWDGIQVGCATQDAAIYRNRIIGYGAYDIAAANHYFQNEGIRVNPGTKADIHDNWIKGGNPGSGSGIFANPYDDSVYSNNVIIAPGESGIVISGDYAMQPGTTIQLVNNTIISPALHGIEFWSEASSGNLAANNLIGDITAVTGEFIHRGTPTVALAESGNLLAGTIAAAGFCDAAMADYHLAAGSAAIDTGVDAATYGVARDYDGVTRPFGSAYDSGAFEYYASPTGAPLIVAQPISQSVRVGRDVELQVIVAGNEPLTYEWRHDGVIVPGATGPRLELPAVTLAQAGSYTVIVTNPLDTITSDAAVLTVTLPPVTPPAITTQPASQTVMVGDNVTFSVGASGSSPRTYQWKKDGSNLSGATAAILTLTATTLADAGSYTVTVTNSAGFADSNAAVLTVNAPPSQPAVFKVLTLGTDATVLPQVNTTNVYTHRININAGSPVTVNGLAFEFGTGNGGGAQAAKNYTLSTFNNAIVNFNSTATGDIHTLLATRSTNTNSATYALTLGGLTAGRRYTFALFNDSAHGVGRNWYRISQSADSTAYDVDFSAGGVNTSRMLTATYTAIGGSVTFTFTRLDGTGTTSTTSWIGFAGFVNYEAPPPPEITTAPVNRSVGEGTNVVLNVTATGAGPLTYQWAKGGVPIVGATSASFTLHNVQPSDAGNFTVTVTNEGGSVTSGPAALTVGATLYTATNLVSDASITPHITPSLGYTHRININATSAVTVNGLAFEFGTGNGGGAQAAKNYTLSTFNNTAANFNSSATGEIRQVLATRATNTNSASYTLTLTGLTPGHTYTFALFNDSGHGPGRNWYRLSQDMDVATSDVDFSAAGVNSSRVTTVTYTPVGSSMALTFTRLDGVGSPGVTSSTSWIGFAGFVNYELPAAPTLIILPKPQTVDAGATAAFGVSARGAAPLAYQWLKNGVPISGATGPTLVLLNAQTADAAAYAVAVTNASGSATSPAVALTVNPLTAPTITAHPVDKSVETGGTAAFTVVATGTAPLNYQWAKDGTAIAGATSATLTLTNVQSAAAGSYTVTVTNSVGTTTGNPAVLTVTLPPPVAPTIATQPVSRTVDINLTATFTVVATGTAPLSYQWFKDGVAIDGATVATLSLPVVQPTAAGSYTVTVTNAQGSAPSNAAVLTVNIPRQTAQRATVAGQFDFNYLLYLPLGYDANGPDCPLVVFLHGYGERSTTETNPMDPVHLNKLKNAGPPLRIQQGTEFPFIMVAPQCATDWWTGSQLEQFILELQQRYRVDRTRIYLTGLSMGGFGVWDLAQRQPSRYAAIAPMSASPQLDAGNSAAAAKLYDLPIWAFHGANDPLYSVTDLQAYLNVIRQAGGDPLLTIYTTAPGNSHDAWVPAYANDALYTWLLSKTAPLPTVTTQPGDATVDRGDSVTFTAVVEGRRPMTYQWTKNGAPISGATLPTLTLTNVQLSDTASYVLTTSNGVGTVQSASADLVVSPVPLAFIQWAVDAGLGDGENGLTDDPDGDGGANLTEFARGSDPTVAYPENNPVSITAVGGQDFPTITFVRRQNLKLIMITVAVSTDLNAAVDLGAVEISATPRGDGLETVVVRSAVPLSVQPRQFFHLKTVLP